MKKKDELKILEQYIDTWDRWTSEEKDLLKSLLGTAEMRKNVSEIKLISDEHDPDRPAEVLIEDLRSSLRDFPKSKGIKI